MITRPCRSHKRRVTSLLRLGVPEAIADASHRLDARLLGLGRGELAPQAGDVDVDGPGLDEAVAAPDDVQELFPSEDAPGRADQGGEQLELLRGELDGAPLHPDLEPVAVDLEVAGLEVGLFL